MPPRFASYWLAAAESGYAAQMEWSSWADRQIEILPIPSDWIIDLSLARTSEELWSKLAAQIENEEQHGFNGRKMHDAIIGYLWLRFERGDLSLASTLRCAGEHADNYDTSVDCESFYCLLSQSEEGQDVRAAAEHLFAPFRQIAAIQWNELQT